MSAANVTADLRVAIAPQGPTVGFLQKNISARALLARGAMALLCAQVDTFLIQLLGRWRCDIMLSYLHVQTHPIMRNLFRLMVQGDAVLLSDRLAVDNEWL